MTLFLAESVEDFHGFFLYIAYELLFAFPSLTPGRYYGELAVADDPVPR